MQMCCTCSGKRHSTQANTHVLECSHVHFPWQVHCHRCAPQLTSLYRIPVVERIHHLGRLDRLRCWTRERMQASSSSVKLRTIKSKWVMLATHVIQPARSMVFLGRTVAVASLQGLPRRSSKRTRCVKSNQPRRHGRIVMQNTRACPTGNPAADKLLADNGSSCAVPNAAARCVVILRDIGAVNWH